MAAFNKFDAFVERMAEKSFNLGSDTLKIMLTNVAPTSANANKADLTEIAAGGGYTAGGTAITVTESAQTGGLYKLKANPVVFTGTGAGFGPFRYAAAYDDTATNDELIGWWDNTTAVSVGDTQTFTVTFDATNGILTIQ
jgi:hypothetical protein